MLYGPFFSDMNVRPAFDPFVVPMNYEVMPKPREGVCVHDIVLAPYPGYDEQKAMVVQHMKLPKVAIMFMNGKVATCKEQDVKIIRPAAYRDSFTWAEVDIALQAVRETMNQLKPAQQDAYDT